MKYNLVLLLILSGFILIGCNTSSETIEVGGLFALTGPGAQFGQDELDGANLAIEEINAEGGVNNKPLTLIVEDTQTDTRSTLSAYRKLVDVNDVEYIVGPTWGIFSIILTPLLTDDGVILVSPSTGEAFEEFKEPNFFKTWGMDYHEMPILYEHMMTDPDIQEIELVITNDGWAETMLQNFIWVGQEYNITIKETHRISGDEKDFKTLLQKIDADALYIVFGSNFDQPGIFLKQMYELDINMPVYAWSGIENQDMLEKYGGNLDPLIYPIPVMTGRDTLFNTKFETKYGHSPFTPAAATAYDAVHLLAIALDGATTIDQTRTNLLSINEYEGASPTVEFDENGWAVWDREYKLRTVRESAFVDLPQHNQQGK